MGSWFWRWLELYWWWFWRKFISYRIWSNGGWHHRRISRQWLIYFRGNLCKCGKNRNFNRRIDILFLSHQDVHFPEGLLPTQVSESSSSLTDESSSDDCNGETIGFFGSGTSKSRTSWQCFQCRAPTIAPRNFCFTCYQVLLYPHFHMVNTYDFLIHRGGNRADHHDRESWKNLKKQQQYHLAQMMTTIERSCWFLHLLRQMKICAQCAT